MSAGFVPWTPPVDGMISQDDGITWFDPGDPFKNRLRLLLLRCGDDHVGTVFYAGLPAMTVLAGPTQIEEEQYRDDIPRYVQRWTQQTHSLFFTNVLGLGDDDPDTWEARTAEGADLYDELLPESDAQGYEWVGFVGAVARAMHAALPDDLPLPTGF